MSSTILTLFCLLNAVLVYGSWILSTSSLPRDTWSVAVGAYNRSIFLLGSFSNQRQIVEYRIDTDEFTDIGQLPMNVWSFAQFWSQKQDMRYLISSGTTLSTFDLKNKRYTADWNIIPVEGDPNHGSCLATSTNHLYVVGGWKNPKTLQVMDLLTYQWMADAPQMNENKGDHACIVYYGYLWVFAGNNERINITNVTSNEWSYIDPLSQAVWGLRAVAWNQSIFIIAGVYTNAGNGVEVDTVHIVDVMTGDVTISPDRLVYKHYSSGVIITNNVIYAFGGSSDSYGQSATAWMKYKLPMVEVPDALTIYNITPNTSSPYTTISTSTVSASNALSLYTTISTSTSIMISNESWISPAIMTIIIVLSTVSIVLSIVCVLWRFCSQRIHMKRSETADPIDIKNDVQMQVQLDSGENSKDLVKEWLTATVGLPQYYTLFIEHGFDSLDFISKIEHREDLEDIGVNILAHKIQIISEIKQLQNQQNKPQKQDIDHKNNNNDSDNDSDHENDDLWESHHARKEGAVETKDRTNTTRKYAPKTQCI